MIGNVGLENLSKMKTPKLKALNFRGGKYNLQGIQKLISHKIYGLQWPMMQTCMKFKWEDPVMRLTEYGLQSIPTFKYFVAYSICWKSKPQLPFGDDDGDDLWGVQQGQEQNGMEEQDEMDEEN